MCVYSQQPLKYAEMGSQWAVTQPVETQGPEQPSWPESLPALTVHPQSLIHPTASLQESKSSKALRGLWGWHTTAGRRGDVGRWGTWVGSCHCNRQACWFQSKAFVWSEIKGFCGKFGESWVKTNSFLGCSTFQHQKQVYHENSNFMTDKLSQSADCFLFYWSYLLNFTFEPL